MLDNHSQLPKQNESHGNTTPTLTSDATSAEQNADRPRSQGSSQSARGNAKGSVRQKPPWSSIKQPENIKWLQQRLALSHQQICLHHQIVTYLSRQRMLHNDKTVMNHFIDLVSQMSQYALSTRIKWFGSTIGAIQRWGYYNESPPLPVQPLKDIISKLRDSHLIERDFDLPGATPADIHRTLRHLDNRAAKVFLTMMWCSAHRGTSIQNILTKDVHLNVHANRQFSDAQTATIRFRKGKTSKTTGVYSITIPIGQRELVFIRSANLAKQQYLFGKLRYKVQQLVSAALKKEKLDIRTIRRGSLRFLAKEGFSLQQLLTLSRHKTVKELYTYLQGGVALRSEAMSQLEMSGRLHSTL